LLEAQEIAYAVVELFLGMASVRVAGSVRRDKDIVGDIDFAVVLFEGILDETFFSLARKEFGAPLVGGVPGMKKAVYLWRGVQLDFWLCAPNLLGPMMLFLTGPASLNIRMRAAAKARGWVLNQYGLFDSLGHSVGEQTEQGIFSNLGMIYQEPKNR
jgi:DNA polymerase (family 10)